MNLSVAEAHQRQGHGSTLLTEVICARRRSPCSAAACSQVRPTNAGAKALYSRFGFLQVAVRPAYYPAHRGREDALVLSKTLWSRRDEVDGDGFVARLAIALR